MQNTVGITQSTKNGVVMTQHTPGPAKITFGRLVIGEFETEIVAVHLTPAKHPVSEGIANLQRIVDCWNQQATIDRLEAEKADLLAELEMYIAALERREGDNWRTNNLDRLTEWEKERLEWSRDTVAKARP